MKCECETRSKLLDTALELMWEHSYGSVSVDDICARADVRKGSFYHFFPSKSDLTVAAFEKNWEESQVNLDKHFSPQNPPLERFRLYAKGLYQWQNEKKGQCGKACGCPYISIGLELSGHDDKISNEVQSVFNRYCRYFESALRDAAHEGLIADGDHANLARQIHAYSVGLLVLVKIFNNPEILKNFEIDLLNFIGAGAPAHSI
jgi:TetR/AcrR family transcriptional regulator, transcriptional repressor for nem operon